MRIPEAAETHPVIYLDNACTSFPKAPGVDEAVAAFVRDGAFNPARGGYRGAVEVGRRVSRLRERLAAIIGAERSERVVFTSGATAAINIAVLGLFADRRARPARVVCASVSHNAIARPLSMLEHRGLVEIAWVRADAAARVDAEELLDAVDERTELVAMAGASNVTGTIQPVGEVGRALRERGVDALLLVDAAQSVGIMETDVARDGVDLLAFAGHKGLRGPTGIGGLYVSPRAFDDRGDPEAQRLGAVLAGGTGAHSDRMSMPPELPKRFEPGTPNTLGMVGLLAAVEAVSADDRRASLAHERRLVSRLRERLGAIPGVSLKGPESPEQSLGVLSIGVEGRDPSEVSTILDQAFGVCVRAGLHCAPHTHRALGTLESGGTVRISPGPSSTEVEVDACATAIEEIARGM